MSTTTPPHNPAAKPETGSYHLLYHLPGEACLRVGALGTFTFPPGWYVYTGSAFGPGGLAARVARHRRRARGGVCPPSPPMLGGPACPSPPMLGGGGADPRPHWHIDALAGAAELAGVALMPDTARRECEHARAIRELPGAAIPVPRFGASDCRCPAHLVHFTQRPPVDFRRLRDPDR